MPTFSYSRSGGGGSAFGSIPQPIPTPDPFTDLSKVYPNLSNTNAAVSESILSKLNGELSSDTVNAIQDAAARFGITSGMPGSGLAWNKSLRDIGLASEQQQQQGLDAYASLIPSISGTQTVRPETQADINTQNAVWKAAPDPAAAASYAQSLFDKYLATMQTPQGGTGAAAPSLGGTSPWYMPDSGPLQLFRTGHF